MTMERYPWTLLYISVVVTLLLILRFVEVLT